MSDVYGFTTTLDDKVFARIAKEASENTNFILVTGKNTVDGDRFLSVLIRTDAIARVADVDPGAAIGDSFVGELVLDAVANFTVNSEWAQQEFFALRFEGHPDDVDAETEKIRYQINRLNNLLDGKIVRVTVESF